MRLLRSKLFIAIVSLFVLTGYGSDVVDFCCAGEMQEQAAAGQSEPGKGMPTGNDGCHCLCHQVFNTNVAEPVKVAPQDLANVGFVAQGDEIPPDAVPVGIEYPPQLA